MTKPKDGEGAEALLPIQHFPKLAAWIERLANTRLEGVSLREWQDFTDTVNAVAAEALAPPATPVRGGGQGSSVSQSGYDECSLASAGAEPSAPKMAVMHPRGAAVISDCGLYRYRLERHGLSGAGAVAWIMVNPSTANATEDDPTIRKVIGFSERMGAGWAMVGNKFAWRATDVRELRSAPDPVGPQNDEHLAAIMREAATVIVAWGPLSKLPPTLKRRWYKVARIADEVGVKLMCFGTAQDGHPRHPLMLAYDTPLVEWRRP